MNLQDQIRKEAFELDRANETLSTQQKDWLSDITMLVKEEIDQDPGNPGKNYQYFLHEQTKVFAYQTGLKQETIKALVYQGFQQEHGKTIDSYAQDKWKEYLSKSDSKNGKLYRSARQLREGGPER